MKKLKITNRVFYNRFKNIDEVLLCVSQNLVKKMHQCILRPIDKEKNFHKHLTDIASDVFIKTYEIKKDFSDYMFMNDIVNESNKLWWIDHMIPILEYGIKEKFLKDGIEEFLKLENEVLSGVSMENTVIATGGSAVYSKDAMENLCKNGIVVYLKLTPDVLVSRLSNIKTRGIAMKKGQTIESLFEERNPLYEKYALYTVDENSLSVEETVTDIICKLNS